MGTFIVKGGHPLSGTVEVSGSKNASLPVIFASLTTRGVSNITGLPRILDVECALSIISAFGARVTRLGDVTYIDTRDVCPCEPSAELTSRLRASTYLIGACLARFGRVTLGEYGGCNFSDRPIDLHILSAERLGASLSGGVLTAEKLHGAEIDLHLPSVGATVNALIMAASAEGETLIRGGARESHIDTLTEYLTSAGAVIEREGGEIRVLGSCLGGGEVKIPPDVIEAGTYLSLSGMTGGGIGVTGIGKESLAPFLEPLTSAGARISYRDGGIYMDSPPVYPVEITTSPHPGFPTDLGPPTVPLIAMSAGGVVREEVWRGRFGYLSELSRAGIRSDVRDSYAIIYPHRPTAAKTVAPDLRGGAALLITALLAEGVSEIASAETVLRGYESPMAKLTRIGGRVLLK